MSVIAGDLETNPKEQIVTFDTDNGKKMKIYVHPHNCQSLLLGLVDKNGIGFRCCSATF